MNTKSIRLQLATFALFMITASSCTKELDLTPQPELPKNTEYTQANIKRGATPTQTDFEDLGNRLSGYLMNTVGYAATISYNGALKTSRAAGSARLAQDGSPRAMSIFDRYSTASVSKTISAVALMKAISTKPQGSALLNTPIWTYLPKHWKYANSSKNITFMQLLNHTSGIRAGSIVSTTDDYPLLKSIMENGVQASNVGVYQYENANYSFLRLLIPAMAGYSIAPIDDNIFMPLSWKEATQAKQYADAYKDYCRAVIFNKLGSCTSQVIDCKNTYDSNPGLYYSFPTAGEKGIVQGDLTAAGAYQGWVLNTFQVDEFLRKLASTSTLIPQSYHNIMINNLAGYDVSGTTSDGVSYYWKNGIYNSSGRGYRSLIIGFGDGVQITIMANSPINLQNAAIAAHQDWVK